MCFYIPSDVVEAGNCGYGRGDRVSECNEHPRCKNCTFRQAVVCEQGNCFAREVCQICFQDIAFGVQAGFLFHDLCYTPVLNNIKCLKSIVFKVCGLTSKALRLMNIECGACKSDKSIRAYLQKKDSDRNCFSGLMSQKQCCTIPKWKESYRPIVPRTKYL